MTGTPSGPSSGHTVIRLDGGLDLAAAPELREQLIDVLHRGTGLPGGLADDEFWDGDRSVKLITWVHVAVTGGFLAVVLGVTVRAMAAGSPHDAFLGWLAIGLGGAAMALGAGYVALDAITTPPMRPTDAPAPDKATSHGTGADARGDQLRVVMTYLPYAAALWSHIAHGVAPDYAHRLLAATATCA